MTSISIAIFIMMLVAAFLGFSIAWVFKSEKAAASIDEKEKREVLILQLKDEQESLIRHSNSLQAETLKTSQKNDKQIKRLQAQKEVIQQLEEEKEFIFKEYETFRKEVKQRLEEHQQLMDMYETLYEKNQKLKLKSDKWKIKFHETQQKLSETEASYSKVKKEKDQILSSVNHKDLDTHNIIQWENKYKELKLKFLALGKEKKDLEEEINKEDPNKNIKENETTLSKLSEEIVILKRENKQLIDRINQQYALPIKLEKDTKSKILARIKSRTKHVDFSRIGKASNKSADDLKRLKGLGLLIEQKFNAIGVNTIDQIANFNEFDQKLFNFFLELPLGKVESEKWVEQARKITGKQDDQSDDIIKRISRNIDKINFDRIGAASPSQKDNLQSIVGIGPFIEEKLNAIGIFRLEQLARLSDDDINEINEIIELAPGHIDSDDWVGQAQRMK